MIYNTLLALYAIVMAPVIFWQHWMKKKSVLLIQDRLGFSPPPAPPGSHKRIWIHAVSLGEMKAAAALISQLRELDRSTFFLVTTLTKTGFEEAKRSLGANVVIRYLPLDFSWTMRRWIRAFRPDQLIFVEGDIWPNLVLEAQHMHVKTALVSGKISEKSARRFKMFRSIAGRLFGSLDLLSVQNEEYRRRFAALIDRPILVTGNIKLDIQPVVVDRAATRHRLGISSDQKVITIASTHAPEERELLGLFHPIWEKHPDLVVFIAPRHPERFVEVSSLIEQLKIPFCRWNDSRAQERLVLVNAMGQLPLLYSISDLAIVAGSFASHRGGHNVAEPCFYHCPVLFGPDMHAQQELSTIVQQSRAGRMVEPNRLVPTILEWLSSQDQNRAQTQRFVEQNRGSCLKTVQMLQKFC